MMLGQFVYAKSGRDKGHVFVIVSVDGEYVYLVDGSVRRLAKPKKKKQKHVQITNEVSVIISEKLRNNSYLLDADIRAEIKRYVGKIYEEE